MSEVAASTPVEPGPVTVRVVGVRKYFGPTRALDGCSFQARAGEIHAIVGGNGCGKSTLAKVISGVLPIDAGAVSILGETPTTPAESRALGISTVFQEVLVADECTVADNIFMGADALFSVTVPPAEKLASAARIMRELSGEAVNPEAMAGTLPLNIKQWITIARSLLRAPRVLVLDESSAALDLDSTRRLFAKIRELKAQGATILIVTHRIAELVEIADRATVMRDGRDVGVLERGEITEANLLALMTGDAAAAEHAAAAPPAPAGPDVLRARGLKVAPGAAPFDFAIRPGEIVGVAGLDGQGQADFVRILAGIDRPAEGRIEMRGRDGVFHEIRSLAEAVRARIAYVSGDRKREGTFAGLSIFENMVMPLYRERSRAGRLALIDWGSLGEIFRREAANLALRFGERDDRITSLSGGNQQKVLIARGFASRPDVIVLNDPARGIDAGAKAEVHRHLRGFAEGGKAVVYMSSELEEFIGFASRVIVFVKGAPFDAFAGAAVDPARILAAMFGQTDGSGLAGRALPPPPAAVVVPLPVPPAPAAPARPAIRIVEFGRRGEVVSRVER